MSGVNDFDDPIARVPDEILDGRFIRFDSVVQDYHGDDFVFIPTKKKKHHYEEEDYNFHDLK